MPCKGCTYQHYSKGRGVLLVTVALSGGSFSRRGKAQSKIPAAKGKQKASKVQQAKQHGPHGGMSALRTRSASRPKSSMSSGSTNNKSDMQLAACKYAATGHQSAKYWRFCKECQRWHCPKPHMGFARYSACEDSAGSGHGSSGAFMQVLQGSSSASISRAAGTDVVCKDSLQQGCTGEGDC